MLPKRGDSGSRNNPPSENDDQKEDEKPIPLPSKISIPKNCAQLAIGTGSSTTKIPTPTSSAIPVWAICTTPTGSTEGLKERKGSKETPGSRLAALGPPKENDLKSASTADEEDIFSKQLKISKNTIKDETPDDLRIEEKDLKDFSKFLGLDGETTPEDMARLAPAPLFSRHAQQNNASDSGSSNVPDINSSTDISDVEESATSAAPSTNPSPGRATHGQGPTSAPRPEFEAPRLSHPWLEQGEPLQRDPFFAVPVDSAERAKTMTTDNKNPPAKDASTLQKFRSTHIEQELAQLEAEAARANPPLGEERKLATFKAPEITAFENYAEQNPDKECVKLAVPALSAALHEKRKDMVEFLQLVNANPALSEGMKLRKAVLNQIMEHSGQAKERGELKQGWWDDLEKAVAVQRVEKDELSGELEEERKIDKLLTGIDSLRIKASDGEAGDAWRKEDVDMNAELAAVTASSQTPALKGSDENRITEEQFKNRLAVEAKSFQDTIDRLQRELNDAVEALRALQEANSDYADQQEPEEARLLREQISALHEEVQWYKAEVLRQNQELAGYSIVTRDEANCDAITAENERLKKKVSSRDELLQNLIAANLQLDEGVQALQTQFESGLLSASGDDRTNLVPLENANKTLWESNESLREEVQKLDRSLAAITKQRDELKNALRERNSIPDNSVSSAIKPENPKLTGLQETIEELEVTEERFRKELQGSEERDMAATNADFEPPELESNKLQRSVAERDTTILGNLKHCEEEKKELQDKIKALESAKAEREAQLQREKRRIVGFEGRDSTEKTGAVINSNSDVLSSEFANAENLEPSSPRPNMPNGDRDHVQPSAGTMEVVIMRCDLVLGQLQAERKRTGYTEGDALLAISVAQEAQGMAERLGYAVWIGRATFWRGIAEWMAGNSTAAEGFFETSATHEWNEPLQERRRLQEWWDTAKTEHVDKTSRRDQDRDTLRKWQPFRRRSWKNEKKSDQKEKQKDQKGGKKKIPRKHKKTEKRPPPAKLYEY